MIHDDNILISMMSDQPPEIKQIIAHQQEIINITQPSLKVPLLTQIGHLLASIHPEGILRLNELISEVLKPIVREIQALDLHEHQQSRAQIQQTFFCIVKLLASAGRNCLQINSFELLQEILTQSIGLFKDKDASDSNSQAEELEWIALVIPLSRKRNRFFHTCVNTMMEMLNGIESVYPCVEISFIRGYFSLILSLEDFIKIQKITQCVNQSVETLESIITKAEDLKVFSSSLNFEEFQKFGKLIGKIIKINEVSNVWKRAELLGALHALSQFQSASIEKKLNGLKGLNKWARHFYGGVLNKVKEEDYCHWLFDNKVISSIFEDGASTTMVKFSTDILRLLFRKKVLDLDHFSIVLQFVERACSENRKMIFKYMDMESIRLDYREYDFLLQYFSQAKRAQFYEQEMFLILGQIIKYSPLKMLKDASRIHGSILQQHLGRFRNNRIEYKCLKNVVRTFIKIIDKSKEVEDQTEEILELYDTYFKEPNRLGLLIFKHIMDDLSNEGFFTQARAAAIILRERQIVRNILDYLKKQTIVEGFSFDLEELLCEMLKTVKDNMHTSDNIILNQDLFYEATVSPKIFQHLTRFLDHTSDFDCMFGRLVQKFSMERFPFTCLRSFFYRINVLWMNKVTEQYAEDQYELICLPGSLKGFDNMKYLMLNAEDDCIREEIADFLSDLYTSYTERKMVEGEQGLIDVMKETKGMLLKEYQCFLEGQSGAICRLKGYLTFVEALMKTTEVLGVGKLRAHNSLVATSTVKVKIINEITYGNDVLQAYDKNFSSSMTLFELIEELSKAFKCPADEIMFREGVRMWPDKWNGLTLEEVKADDKVLTAVKSFRNRIRKEPLTLNGEITPKARAVFQQIYHSFAVEGKMGKKECARYVAEVTNTLCEVQDSRVTDFFKEYDSGNDEKITLEDFLKFYSESSNSSSREEVVWKNLANMRYRKDLKKFDEHIEPPQEELLFRSYLASTPEVYSLLHVLTKCQVAEIRVQAIKLLFRLPTDPQSLKSLSSELNLADKNCFQTEYILIAIKSFLNNNSEDGTRQKNVEAFVQCGNTVRIFDMMQRIDSFSNADKDEVKCLYISLQILRSLMGVPCLKEQVGEDEEIRLQIDLPETDLFLKLAGNSYKNMDLDILESSLTLQLTQRNCDVFSLAQEGVFHAESEIRKIATNYIFILYRLGRVKVDLFSIEPKNHPLFWFELLVKVIDIDGQLDCGPILLNCIKTVRLRGEDIRTNPEDMVIFGNLAIVLQVIEKQRVQDLPAAFVQDIMALASRLISIRNRKMVYSILASQDLHMTIEYIQQLLLSVKPLKDVVAKQYYVGLKNLGSTCYMNSTLQVLFLIKEFKYLVLGLECREEDKQLTEVNGRPICDDILLQLKKMYSYLHKSVRSYFQPQDFCLTIKDPISGAPINPRIQEDAHEFVGNFLEKIERQCVRNNKFEEFKDLIVGRTMTQFTCHTCSNKIAREENFYQLPLQVKNLKDLRESLEKFVEPQPITGYFCEVCAKQVDSIEKSTSLSQLPQLMIIGLQRIIFDLEIFQKVKVDSAFNFSAQFNFYDFVSKDSQGLKPEDCEYDLRGIVVHSGTSESGHYYSIIKDRGQWFKFNDQSVTIFDIKNLAREAFGGTESQDHWNDELKFSTNAYILFYEKKKNHPSRPHTPPQPNSNSNFPEEAASQSVQLLLDPAPLSAELQAQIQANNTSLFKELQVHQQSIFEFIFEVFDKIKPADMEDRVNKHPFEKEWDKNLHLKTYELIYELMWTLVKFSTVFYNVRNQLIFKLGCNMYLLFYLLPRKSYQMLMELSVQDCVEGLCLHNDDTIRSVYKCMVNKAMHTFYHYEALNLDAHDAGNAGFKCLIEGLFDFFFDERLFKNAYKMHNFFDFWNLSLRFIQPVLHYALSREILVVMVDVLMANDSPLFKEQEEAKKFKRQEIPQFQSFPLVHIVHWLMLSRKNLKDQINPSSVADGQLVLLTESEKKMVGDINFYKKMINKKCDNGMLAEVTTKLCYKDLEFSKKMVEIFLRGLSSSYSSEQEESSLIMIKHLKGYLLIEDEFTASRLKWVLGIPQLEVCEDSSYGLKQQHKSVAFCFVSPLFFAQSDQYQPVLNVLFLKSSFFTLFSVSGVILLLQLMCESDQCLKYVMSLPAPTYMYRNYIDWIWDYISKLKDKDHFYLQFDKTMYHNQLVQLYHRFMEKLKASLIPYHIPVNPKIIGKNKESEMRATFETPVLNMALWAHKTYYLENEPTGSENNSLPKELFQLGSPEGFAKLFVSTDKECMEQKDEKEKEKENEFNIPSEWTIYTLHIETKQDLKLIFKFEKFQEEIVFLKGKTFINFPYEEMQEDLMDRIDFEVLEGQIDTEEKKQEGLGSAYASAPKISEQFQSMLNERRQFDFSKECSFCTFINYGGRVCEICQNTLY